MTSDTRTTTRGVIRFINIRGEYANPRFKHLNFALEREDGSRYDYEWHTHVGVEYIDIRKGDEVEISWAQAKDGSWYATNIRNFRNGVTYTLGAGGCLLALTMLPFRLLLTLFHGRQ